MKNGYSIFEIFVFILFFPVIITGWIVRYIIYKKKLKCAEDIELYKLKLLDEIAEKKVDN